MTKLLVTILLFCSFASARPESPKVLVRIEKQMNLSLEDRARLTIEKNQLQEQIAELQEKIKTKKNLILKRLKALNSLKKFKWGELLLNNGFDTLDRNIKILKNLNKYDYELFKEYSTSLKMLAVARKNLLETEILIQQNVESLKLQQEDFLKLEAILIQALNQLKKDSLLMFKGRLSRPLDGQLKQEFGSVRDQHNQFYLVNHGELYSTKKNTPVRTVGLGTIIFRDELLRWRETLIVQHEDNYYSVYAGILNLKKQVGDRVTKNELVGFTAGEDFYFELRHFDNPINPKYWYHKE